MVWLRKLAPGALLSEVLKVVASIVIGVLLVTLLIFAPQSFLGRVGRDAGIEIYFQAVGNYLGQVSQGDLAGGARSGRVGRELITAAQRSAQLIAFSLIAAVPLGVIWGGLLALPRPRLLANLLFGLNVLILALPSFVMLILAIETVVDLNRLIGMRLFYTNGYGLDSHILVPGGILAVRGAAFLARIVHAAHDEVLRQDWLRAARARGLG
ncbi:MAG: ABC transporter permease subunit, partial [Oscillochloris sp.]|nr:ABC transporter permease subunit [Oscillochloris sp.]